MSARDLDDLGARVVLREAQRQALGHEVSEADVRLGMYALHIAAVKYHEDGNLDGRLQAVALIRRIWSEFDATLSRGGAVMIPHPPAPR
jgi:hypothetical protein